MKEIVCYGIDKSTHQYMCIEISDTADLQPYYITSNPDSAFNEKKYYEIINQSKKRYGYKTPIYTVLASVVSDLSYNDSDILGYLVINDKNNKVEIMQASDLIQKIRRYGCMNYSLSNANNTLILRRNPKSENRVVKNSFLNQKLGINFNNLSLSETMTKKEFEFCLKSNGFNLVFSAPFKYTRWNYNTDCVSQIYMNKEGTMLQFNLFMDPKTLKYRLTYFGNTLVAMREINEKAYLAYIQESPYDSGSSTPIDYDDTHIIIYSQSEYYRFMRVARNYSKYSKPVKPLYRNKDMECLFWVLPYLRYQKEWVDEKGKKLINDAKKETGSQGDTIKIYLEKILAYHNVLKSDESLKKLFSNYGRTMNEFINLLNHNKNISENKPLSAAYNIYLEWLKDLKNS